MAVALDLGADNALRDYTDLVAKVRLWLDRDDLDGLISTFIRLAEGHLNRQLRTPEMEAVVTLPAIGGALTLPLDAISVRGITVAGRPLIALSPTQLSEAYGSLAGFPRGFAITGRQVALAPLADTSATLTYWQRIPALTLSQPSNWLFAAHSDVYLFGALFQANAYIVDTEAAARWGALFDAAVDAVSDLGSKARYGGPIVARAGPAAIRGVRA